MESDGVQRTSAPLLARAHALNVEGRHGAALEFATKALTVDPDCAEPHCELAHALHQLGRNHEALAAADAAVRLAPNEEWPHRLRSVALLGLRQAPAAVAAAQMAVYLAPGTPYPMAALAQAQLSMRTLPQAYATALELVRIAPELALSHFVVGQVAIASKNWRIAETANREVLRLEPLDHAALNNLGVALQAMGRKAEALRAYQDAARLDPMDAVARGNMVHLVRPVEPRGLAIDAMLAVIVPLSLPYLAGKYIFRLVRSRHWRSRLQPGARLYYDRTAWVGGIVRAETLIAGAAVFGVGLISLGFAQAFGWTYVTTGVPVTVLFLASVAIAGSSALWRIARWLWDLRRKLT